MPTPTPDVSEPITPPAHFDQVVAEIERAIGRQLDEPCFPAALTSAVGYAALGAGKRLRPALTLLSCEAAGADRSRAMTPAIAVELIHAFSLVHDDLPALDNDELRRGKPTVHVRFGEATAILAGDAMMSMAFGLLARTPGVECDTTTALVRELSQATNRMIAGQMLDTVGDRAIEADKLARVRLIHEQKTGALISAACRMGAIVAAPHHAAPHHATTNTDTDANADAESLDALTRFGEAIGLMFQIVDDLIDVEQHESHTGKKTGKDTAADKLTYPGVIGVEATRRAAYRLRDEATAALSPLGDRGRTLRALTAYLASRTR